MGNFSVRYSLVVHEEAKRDLDAIYEIDEDAAADVETFLEEAKNDQELLDNLSRNGFVGYGEVNYSVAEWVAIKKERYNLWRLKFFDVSTTAKYYRVIYAFDPCNWRYYVLGVLNRDDAYDFSCLRNQQILETYNQLDLPRY